MTHYQLIFYLIMSDVDNKIYFRAKGLANMVEDPIVSSDQLYGKVIYKSLIVSFIYKIVSTSIGFYLFMPTIMYRPVTPSYDPLTNLVLKITFFFDEPPLNCFPSLHCLFCFQEIISFIKSKCKTKRKIWVSCCAMLIILSTLFVKQHYIYDVLSALLIALIANALSSIFHLYDNTKEPFRIFKKRKSEYFFWENEFWAKEKIQSLVKVIK